MTTHQRPSRLTVTLRWCVALSGLFGLSSAQAMPICVTNAAQLEAALILGTIQPAPYTIMLVQGTYVMNESVDIRLSAPTTIEGGYTANCADRVVDPANTAIHVGHGHNVDLRQEVASPHARLTLDGFTLGHTNGQVLLQAGQYGFISDDAGRLELRRMALRQIGNQVRLFAYDGSMTLDNTLIEHIGSSSTACAVDIWIPGGGKVNINHMTADLSTGKDFCLGDEGDDDAEFSIYNSILWASEGGIATFRGPMEPDTAVAFVNSIFFNQLTGGAVTIINQIDTEPRWIDPANGDYRLKTNPLSPAINSGTYISPGGEPATDIEGHLRIIGSAPDRGAYESPYNDQSVLIVSNTNDSGLGSLRQALLDANSTPAIAKQIKFDIRGVANVPACPAVIALSSALPTINAPIAINGYTQPLSSPNTDAEAFNAVTCIVVKPASGTLPVAFRVPQAAPASVAFNLRGVGLGGFAQPVMLLGGSNHVVAGNQFGGSALGVNLPGATFNAIAIGVNAGGSLIVGGPNAADRNVIVDADFSGINIQAEVQSSIDQCQIVNNLIGLKPDGHSALANNVGINVSGAGCGIRRNRIAGNSLAQIWLNGGSQQNVVQQNLIGITTQGGGVANSAIGVLINGSGNLIGAGASTFTANTIRYNQGGGVVIQGDSAVSGNAVTANFIHANGPGGNGMDIDLQPSGGATGPTANDAGDGDSGPNFLQNFPLAKSLVYTAPGAIDRPATLGGVLDALPGNHRIDAYFSSEASPHGRRGHAQLHLGRLSVVVPASGHAAFTLPILVPTPAAGGVLSLTATDSVGNTSEIGTALSTDAIFVDGLD